MELKKLTERIWFMPYEEERDRPNLGYIKGDNRALAVDAGHSEEHVKEFYALLEKEGLPLPDLTVIPPWHWDHTFGMHAIHGLSLTNERTNEYLKEKKEEIEKEGPSGFLSINDSVRKEYEGGKEVIVVPADMTFRGEMTLDLGGVTVKIVTSEAPHTDDSTLVFVCEDSVLFLGDATCNAYPGGPKDKGLSIKLADTIRGFNPKTCMEGHWVPTTMDDTLSDLLS